MRPAARESFLFVLALVTACGAKAPAPPTVDVVAEAKALLTTYREATLTLNTPAIVALYHPDGAWWLGDGKKSFATPDSIAKFYGAGSAMGIALAEFEWHDLTFEPLGPDAVVVAGRFHWRSKDGKSDTLSYSSLLVRHDGTLKIRVEDESAGQPN